MEIYQQENLKLYNADCLDLLATLPDNSIDLIATDPPYFRVVSADWDRQWKTETEFFNWGYPEKRVELID